MKKKQLTNTQLLNEIMEWSPAGPLVQAFVIQALETFAVRVIAAGPEACDSPMVSGKAWVKCAVEVQKALREHLG